ncbi:MAG: terminase small subunit [Lachnospiraceae bacterium]|nr:terminase small subunit [Lachnospiraceae bacterium]
MAKLTEKQQRFVDEYLIDLNATQAAIRAGYSVKRASEIGYQLLQKTTVQQAISEKMAERSKRTGINQDRILMELARIALLNSANVVNYEDATIKEDALPDDLAAVASVKVKRFPTKDGGEGIEREIKFCDKVRALELAGKHLGMFKDKLELSGGLAIEQSKLDDLIRQMRGGG